MQNKKSLNGGYVMLFLLMIGLVLMVTFIVRTDLFTSGDKGVLEKGIDAVENAREVKKTIENNYKFDPEEQEKSIDNLN